MATIFDDIQDPRLDRKKAHPLENILVISLCAIIASAEDFVSIEKYGNAKLPWFSSFLDMENGVPSHDTFRRVLSILKPAALEKCFRRWVNTLASNLDGEVIAVDGKSLRRAHNKKKNRSAIHMVSAWALEYQVILGQVKTEEKSNEITAIPELLQALELSGSTITIDAMGCQKEMAKQIVERGGHYVIGLKDNQPSLRQQVEEFISDAQAQDFDSVACDYHETVEKGHGRQERRRYWHVDLAGSTVDTDQWQGLSSVMRVESERKIKDKTSLEHRYYISSYTTIDAKLAARAVRGHWGIESTHWSLDMSFREDESRTREGYAQENLSIFRRLALNLLKQEKTAKVGVKNKRLMAGWNDLYMDKVLNLLKI